MSDEEAADEVDPEAVVESVRDRLESIRADIEPVRGALEPVREELDPVQDLLEDAETEADLDEVEAELEPVEAELGAVREDFEPIEEELEAAREDLETIAPEDEDEDEDEDDESETPEPYTSLEAEVDDVESEVEEVEDEIDELEGDVDDVESGVEDQRGPYAEDVIDEVDGAKGDIETTRWTEEGRAELRDVVEDALEEINTALGTSLTLADDEDVLDRLLATLEDVEAEIDEAGLDPDEDAETIASLLETTDELQEGVDEATAWDDLTVREQLRREGFYDVLDHVKDFPPEWHALKVHEKRGNVEMILLALDSLDSGYMEDHCLEALARMGPEEAIDPMLQRAQRRDEQAIAILGKIGVEDDRVVDKLLDYVDSSPPLQRASFRALGEIGAEEAVQPIANQLVADDSDIRSRAARALGLIGDTRAIDPLAERLEEDDEDVVRASAAWALNQIATAEALEALTEYADDRSYLVQAEAEKAV